MLIATGRVVGSVLVFFGGVATFSGSLWGIPVVLLGAFFWLAANADERRNQ